MRRVAVTTDRFEEVSSFYLRSGFLPVPVPTIRVVPEPQPVLEEARQLSAGAEMLLLTSPRTPRLLWPEGPMPTVPVAAVGARTAAEVEKRGGSVAVVGQQGLVDLARDMVSSAGCPGRLVFPRAAGSDPASLAPLLEAGTEVMALDVYRSIPLAPASTPVDAVTFASPSAVEGWMSSRNLEGLIVAVIGATTAAAVTAYRPPDLVADRPSHRAMAETMAHYMEVNA